MFLRTFFLSTLFFGIAQGQTAILRISDRLVQDLDCKKISVSEIYSTIRPEAYSVAVHLPDKNWSTGFLANCWSLAHAQRILFMLSRVAPAADLSEAKLRGVLDLLRGSTPEEGARFPTPIPQERALKQYTVFSTDRNFSEGSQLFSLLQQGIYEPWSQTRLFRNFKREVEVFQNFRFYRPSNLPMGLGQWERGTAENRQSFQALIKNIDHHRLSLVNLRGERTVQHVVIPKRYEVAGSGKYIFFVYDSNFPDRETSFAYDSRIQQFEGGSVMGAFYHTPYLTKAVGLFIVDEDEQQKIDESLVRFYQKSCQQQVY